MKIWTILFFSIALISCGGKLKDNTDVSTSLVYNTIVLDVKAFLESSKSLEASSNKFCSSLKEDSLIKLQNNWKDLSLSWNRLEHYNFGPINDLPFNKRIDFINSFRVRGIDYTSRVRAFIDATITKNKSRDFDNLNFDKVGLLALEVLIFETSGSEPSTKKNDILGDYVENSKKCYLLKGYANQIVKQATYIDNGWRVNHLSTGLPFSTIYLSGKLEDGSNSLTSLLVGVQKHLDYIKKRKVLSRTAKISQFSYENAKANILAIEKMLEGTGLNSFFSNMIATGHEKEVMTVRENIASIKRALEDKDQVSYEAAIGLLDGNFKREIPSSLDIKLGLNFSDGD